VRALESTRVAFADGRSLSSSTTLRASHEVTAPSPPGPPGSPSFSSRPIQTARHRPGAARWTFGDQTVDAGFPHGVLDTASLHEIKPASYADWSAALSTALRLAARHLVPMPANDVSKPILWCQSSAQANDLGRLYAPGLESLGLSAEALIVVEAPRFADVLWALEEGLGSEALALVVGVVEEVGLTPSRRLALAAAAHGTPCLLLTAPGAAAAPAAMTRWRVGRAASAGHPFDRVAAGASRTRLTLERYRAGAPLLEDVSLTVEWCDAARAFRLASGMADRAPRTIGTRLHTG
jgi:protein ImuA